MIYIRIICLFFAMVAIATTNSYAQTPVANPNISCAAQGLDFVCFDWEPVEGANNFQLIYTVEDETPVSIQIAETQYCVNDLSPNSSINVDLIALAIDPIENSNSEMVSLSCTAQSPVPLDSPNLVCLSDNEGGICIEWQTIELADSFKVNHSISGVTFLELVIADTTFCVSGLYTNDLLQISVTAINSEYGVESNPSYTECFSTNENQLPLPELECNSASTDVLCFSWEAIEGAMEYQGAYLLGGEIFTVNTIETDYCITGLAPNTAINFFLRAVAENPIESSFNSNLSCSTICDINEIVWEEYPESICIWEIYEPLVASPAGGVFSGPISEGGELIINQFETLQENYITYTVVVDGGCELSSSIPIFASGPKLLTPERYLCAGETTSLIAANANSFTWEEFGTENVYEGDTIQVSPEVDTYFILRATDEFGCAIEQVATIFIVEDVTVDAGEDVVICPGEFITLTATGSIGCGYFWESGQECETITVSPVETTTYQVMAVAGESCTATDEVTVFVSEPSIDLPAQINRCEAGEVELSTTEYPGYTYDWSSGGSESNTSLFLSQNSNIELTVWDADGCEKSQYVEILFSELELDLGPDVQICQGESITVNPYVQHATSFEWSNGEAVESNVFSPEITSTYALTVYDDLGCEKTDSITVWVENCTPLPNPDVWPGDANTDGIANNFDVLSLGLAYGLDGPSRLGASTNWEAQFCENWEGEITLSNEEDPDISEPININAKYSDCDGNGIVEEADVDVISLNYDFVHPRHADEELTEGPNIWIEMPAEIEVDSWITVTLNIGTSEEVAEGVHGYAFSIEFDPSLVDPTSISVDFSDSWLAGDLNLNLAHVNPVSGKLDLAFSRTDQTDITGFGKVAQVDIFVIDNIDGKQDAIEFTLNSSNSRFINSLGEFQQLQEGSSTSEILTAGPINKPAYNFTFGPNPAHDFLFFETSNSSKFQWSIFNSNGQKVLAQKAVYEASQSINLSNLPEGLYFLKVEEENKKQVHKFQIIR